MMYILHGHYSRLLNKNYIEDIINNLVQDEKMMQGITRLRNYIQEKLQTKRYLARLKLTNNSLS